MGLSCKLQRKKSGRDKGRRKRLKKRHREEIVHERGKKKSGIATTELTTQPGGIHSGKETLTYCVLLELHFQEKYRCIHLTQKNLLSNFVWDEVTENCKFSHAVENHPA